MRKNSVWAGRGLIALAAAVGMLWMFAAAAWAAPTNDDFSAAMPVSPGSVSGNNFEASKQGGEPDHAGNAGGKSVWFSWTPSKSGLAGISVPCFAGMNPLIAVYTGSVVNALSLVASNEDVPPTGGCPFTEPNEFWFAVDAGTTYRIAVDGRDGEQNSFSFDLRTIPANDDLGDAIVLGAELPQDASGTVKFASKQAGEPDHAGDPGGHSVWYSWTPAASGPVEIATCSPFSNLDPLLAVYTGSNVAALTPVAANDDTSLPTNFPECAYTDSRVSFTATAGTTYRIAIDGANGTIGRFNLRLRGRPANDDFADAQTLLPGLPTNATAGTSARFATKQAGEPNHAGDPGGHSVWFTWTPASSGPVAISACAFGLEEFDTLLAVYTGSNVAALTPVAANDDAATGCGFWGGSEVEFEAVAGTTYRIAVDGKEGVEGRFTLNLEGGPANDAFASAKDLGTEPFASGFGSTKLATKQAGEPDHAGDPGGHSVWFTWTPAASGQTTITACPYNETGGDPVLAVYTGASVNALTPVASDANGGAGCDPDASQVEFEAVAGTPYRIAVDSAGAGGSFDLRIEGEPENDDFASPDVINPIPLFASGSTRFASKQAGEPDHAGDPGGHSVWFSWTPDDSGPVGLVACGEEVDTLLAVYTGSAVNALTPVAGNDDAPHGPPNEICTAAGSEVEFEAVAGTTYRIAVDSKGTVQGRFSLAFERTPENDVFADSTPLGATLPVYANLNLKLAGKEAGEPNHAGDPGGHSVWFSWAPASDRQVALSTCAYNGGLDTLLAVYTGSNVAALTPVAANDDVGDGRCKATDSEVRFDATAGTTYWIAIDGKGGSAGDVQLLLEGLEANDDFGRPQPLGGIAPTGSFGSNRFATKQAGEPDHAGDAGGSSVWFKWTAPRSGPAAIDTCRSNFDTLLAVYTGSAVNALTPVASNDDAGGKCSPQSRVTFDAVANAVYRIAVDGKADAQGLVELGVNMGPANDAFSKPRKLVSLLPLFVSEGSTVLASKETGEPNHSGNAGGHSVWFTWTAPQSATIALTACTEDFEPLIGVYTGSAVNALTSVPASPTDTGECEAGSSVAFSASAGTTYRIAVDGSGGEEGEFELWFEQAAAPTTHLLSVAKTGGGSGSVSSSPAGISCGSTCSQAFEAGSVITLTATPAAASTFTGWSGGGCSGTGACQLTLGADTTVHADFSVSSSGGGGGGGGGGTPPPPPPDPKPPVKKPLKCKPGFKKVKVKGKQKCVKKKKPGKGKGRGHKS